jgi:hypothetical protein
MQQFRKERLTRMWRVFGVEHEVQLMRNVDAVLAHEGAEAVHVEKTAAHFPFQTEMLETVRLVNDGPPIALISLCKIFVRMVDHLEEWENERTNLTS